MQIPFPKFKSRFLRDVCRAFQRRRKAIAYSADFYFETDPKDEFEWIVIYHESRIQPIIILQLVEDSRFCLYLRSQKVKNRGKVLVELNDRYLICNAEQLVETFEKTISMAFRFKQQTPNRDLKEAIEAEWLKHTLRLVK